MTLSLNLSVCALPVACGVPTLLYYYGKHRCNLLQPFSIISQDTGEVADVILAKIEGNLSGIIKRQAMKHSRACLNIFVKWCSWLCCGVRLWCAFLYFIHIILVFPCQFGVFWQLSRTCSHSLQLLWCLFLWFHCQSSPSKTFAGNLEPFSHSENYSRTTIYNLYSVLMHNSTKRSIGK